MEILLMFLGAGALGLYTKAVLITCFIVVAININRKREITTCNHVNIGVLLIFTVAYNAIMYSYGKFSLSFLITPCIAYYMGSVICNERKNENEISRYIVSIAIGLVIHAILNFIYSLIENNVDRNTLEIWSRQIHSATLQGLLLVMIESLFYYIIAYVKSIRIKIILLILFVVGLIYNIRLGTRSTLVVCAIVFVSAMILSFFLEKDKKKFFKRLGIILLCITCIVVLIVICYMFNLCDIRDKIDNSHLVKRLINKKETGYSNNIRILALKFAFTQLFDYPFGGYQMKLIAIKYVHNMWLDVNYAAGIIPFVLIVLYTILMLKSLIMTIGNKNFSNSYKILVFSIYLGVFMSFAFEPIIEGAPYYFIMFCLINGLVDKRLVLEKRKEKTKSENIVDC